MKVSGVSKQQAISECAWCGESIPLEAPVFGFGGKVRPGVDLTEFEGNPISMSLATQDRSVVAIIPTADSQARLEGYDFIFMVCSQECGFEMRAALETEVALGDALLNDIAKININ